MAFGVAFHKTLDYNYCEYFFTGVTSYEIRIQKKRLSDAGTDLVPGYAARFGFCIGVAETEDSFWQCNGRVMVCMVSYR